MNPINSLLAWVGAIATSSKTGEALSEINMLWEKFCKWQSTFNEDNIDDNRSKVIVSIDTFRWSLLEKNCKGTINGESGKELFSDYKKTIKNLRENVRKNSLNENDASKFKNLHFRFLSFLERKNERISFVTKIVAGISVLVILFLIIYKSYNAFSVGVYNESIESVSPRMGYYKKDASSNRFIPTDKHQKELIANYNKKIFSKNGYKEFEEKFYERDKYKLAFKMRSRNSSSTIPLFISSVGANVKLLKLKRFPWDKIKTDVAIEAKKNGTSVRLNTYLSGPALDLSAIVSTLNGDQLYVIRKDLLLQNSYLTISPADEKNWSYYDEDMGMLHNPIVYFYDEDDNVSIKNQSVLPVEPGEPFIIDCMEPMFGLSDTYQFLELLSENKIRNYSDLFKRQTYIENRSLMIDNIPFRIFLEKIKPFQYEFEKYLNCFGEDNKFEIISSEKRLGELTTIKEVKGLKIKYNFQDLKGSTFEDEASVVFDKPMKIYELGSHFNDRQGFIQYSTGMIERDRFDAAHALLSGESNENIKGESIIKADLNLVLDEKEPLKEKWQDINKILAPGGYLILTTSLLKPQNGYYKIDVYVNEEVVETFWVDALAPEIPGFNYKPLSYWRDIFRKN